jgi:hypothetical protein
MQCDAAHTISMPLSSSTAPSTRENTPVPIIHSLVRPPLRTEGARSAGREERAGGREGDDGVRGVRERKGGGEYGRRGK